MHPQQVPRAKKSTKEPSFKEAAAEPHKGRLVEVTIRRKGSLGIVLLDDLSVKGVHQGLLTATDLVRPGDVLVSINGQSTMKPYPIDALEAVSRLQKAALPKRLVFHTESPNSAPSNTADAEIECEAPEESDGAEPDLPSEGFLRLVSPSILDGQSYPIRFALFGTVPSHVTDKEFRLQMTKPGVRATMACDKLLVEKDELKGTLVLVKRGMCSFVQKARELQKHGAAGMLVISQEENSIIAMPAGPNELRQGPVPMMAAMISARAGSDLEGLASRMPTLVKIELEESGSSSKLSENEDAYIQRWQYEVTQSGRQVERRKVDGTLRLSLWSPGLSGDSTGMVETIALEAIFGSQWKEVNRGVSVAIAPTSHDACVPMSGTALRGSVVFVRRGKCPFSTKAIHVQNAGGVGMLIVNSEAGIDKLVQMPGDPENEEQVRIPCGMIDPSLGNVVMELLLVHPKEAVIARIAKTVRYYCDVRNNILCGDF